MLKMLIDKREAEKSQRLSRYKPHSGAWRNKPDDGQAAFHKSGKRIRCVLGGNQGGKSISGVIEALWTVLGIHPHQKIKVPNHGRIIASLGFEEGANQVIIPKIYEWLPKGVLKGEPRRNQNGVPVGWEFQNGSSFNILSGQQDVTVFEGWTGDWAWIDEPPKKEIYDATRRGLLKTAGKLWMTLTPLREPWLYNDLYQPWTEGEREDIDFFTIDIWDNCIENGGSLPREAIEDFVKDLDPEDRDARIHGKFRFLSGRIYPMYDPAVHVVPWFRVPAHWPVWDGIDPHLQKEHAYCQWAINPDEEVVYVCDEIYSKVTIPAFAEIIKEKRKGKNIVHTLIDWSAETPDAISRETVRRALERCGVRTSLAKKMNNVDHGIQVMRDLLTPKADSLGRLRPRFYIMDTCRRHCKEFMNYVQDDRSTEYIIKDKPRKIWDDMMDLDRYFVVENPLEKLHAARAVRVNEFKYGFK